MMFKFFKSLVGIKEERKFREFIDWETLEEKLLEADISYELIERIKSSLPSIIKINRMALYNNLFRFLQENFYEKIELKSIIAKPLVHLILGVNGAGKTTTIAKLAFKFKDKGNVMLAAGDTFRAAATEQLKGWGERLDVPVIASKIGGDPAAVAFDAIKSARARNIDFVFIDTAGRLENKVNLTNELIKISNTCSKALGGADFYKFLVLDGLQGQNAINQARVFNDALGVDGIILTKLDSSSRGGAIFSILHALKIPIIYLGVGEGAADLIPFNADDFLEKLLDYIYEI